MKKIVILAAALLGPIGIANAQGDPEIKAPEVKEGLWSIHRVMIDNPGNKKTESTTTICRDHAYDRKAQAVAKSVKGCTTANENFQGGKYSLELHCVVGSTTIDTKGTSVYQGDTAAHSESRTTYSPAFGGVTDSTMIMDQKYVGACPAGAKPGDMTAEDGHVIHLGKN